MGSMRDSDDFVASRHMVWESNVPQNLVDLYFNYIRVLPSWRRSFPRYIPATIRNIVELPPNKIKVVTGTGEYVFVFEERNTLVSPAAEFVKTGVFRLLHNDSPVLDLNISPPDAGQAGNSWVTRGIEQLKDGEWITELTQLHSQLAHCETEQKINDELLKEDDLKNISELKEKFSKLPSAGAKTPSWFRRLWRRSGI
jgi:hypothetical protein